MTSADLGDHSSDLNEDENNRHDITKPRRSRNKIKQTTMKYQLNDAKSQETMKQGVMFAEDMTNNLSS
jgi:hypothetical protein